MKSHIKPAQYNYNLKKHAFANNKVCNNLLTECIVSLSLVFQNVIVTKVNHKMFIT